MSSEQPSLSSFADQDPPTGDSEREEADQKVINSESHQPSGEDLPDCLSWESQTEKHLGATIHPAATSALQKVNGTPSGIYSHLFNYVTSGFDTYLKETKARSVSVPSSYNDFGAFQPRLTFRSAGTDSGMFGLTANHLEAAIRVITGGGRFNADSLSIFAGRDQTFGLVYEGDQFIINVTGLDPLKLDEDPIPIHEPRNYEVGGFDVVEDDPAYREALETVLRSTNAHTDLTPTEYVGLRGSTHTFNTQSDTQLRIKGNELRKVMGVTESPDVITGKHDIEDLGETERTVTVPDVPVNPGEELRLGGRAIGYELRIDNGGGGIYSSGATSFLRDGATLEIVCYGLSLRDREDRDYTSVSITDRSFTAAKYQLKHGEFVVSKRYREQLA